MMDDDDAAEPRLRPHPSETVALRIPTDTLAVVRRIAAVRDMTTEALLKFYIGQGLRGAGATPSPDRILETTAEVLARHIPSEEERSAILREIRGGAEA